MNEAANDMLILSLIPSFGAELPSSATEGKIKYEK